VDARRFDTMARSLARVSSRRGVLSGALGGSIALLTGSSVLAIRDRIRRAKNRRGQDEPVSTEGALPTGALTGGVWEETIEMCHYDPEIGGFRIVPVSTVAVSEHLDRGDTLYIDCCAASDCGWRPCLVSTGCISGACAYDATVNAQCDLGNGVMGICRSDAVCVPVSTGVEVAEAAVG
jgi:hypothetical protein